MDVLISRSPWMGERDQPQMILLKIRLWERLFGHGCPYVAEPMDGRERPAANDFAKNKIVGAASAANSALRLLLLRFK